MTNLGSVKWRTANLGFQAGRSVHPAIIMVRSSNFGGVQSRLAMVCGAGVVPWNDRASPAEDCGKAKAGAKACAKCLCHLLRLFKLFLQTVSEKVLCQMARSTAYWTQRSAQAAPEQGPQVGRWPMASCPYIPVIIHHPSMEGTLGEHQHRDREWNVS